MSDDSRYQFWADLIEAGASTDAYYHGFNPRRSGAIQQRTGIPGVFLCFRLRESYTQVTVTIENIGFERSLNFFQQLHQHREEVESGISSPLEWQPANEYTSSSRIIATLEFEESSSIEQHYELMIATMDEFREVLLPYIYELQDLE
mgnify:CR=1 FL=1